MSPLKKFDTIAPNLEINEIRFHDNYLAPIGGGRGIVMPMSVCLCVCVCVCPCLSVFSQNFKV